MRGEGGDTDTQIDKRGHIEDEGQGDGEGGDPKIQKKTKESIWRMRSRMRVRAEAPTHEKTKEGISEMRTYKFNLRS